MSVVVVTRFRVARPRHVAPFLAASLRAAVQARGAAGARRVEVYAQSGSVYWTLTEWEHGRDVRAYRDASTHGRIMQHTDGWASEALVVRWRHHDESPPRLSDVAEHRHHAVFLPLTSPSADHAAGRFDVPTARMRLVFRSRSAAGSLDELLAG